MSRNHKRHSPKKPDMPEGKRIPLTRWACECGRRFRGDVRLDPHMKRSRHVVAFGRMTPRWKDRHFS